jgi:pSer/pThr/pTyr-binding forkhead associated (FHA) protein
MATCPSGHESADDDFCDVCGFAIGPMDVRGSAPPTLPRPVVPAPQAPRPSTAGAAAWTAVVSADRAYYDSLQAAGRPGASGIGFPASCPQRQFRLTGAEVRVGRLSDYSGSDCEIDLTGPPADPGVSRLHAVLLRGQNGSWSVVDPGSANGTLVNGAEIARNEIVPLQDGDRIHLGAWTELRIVSEG